MDVMEYGYGPTRGGSYNLSRMGHATDIKVTEDEVSFALGCQKLRLSREVLHQLAATEPAVPAPPAAAPDPTPVLAPIEPEVPAFVAYWAVRITHPDRAPLYYKLGTRYLRYTHLTLGTFAGQPAYVFRNRFNHAVRYNLIGANGEVRTPFLVDTQATEDSITT